MRLFMTRAFCTAIAAATAAIALSITAGTAPAQQASQPALTMNSVGLLDAEPIDPQELNNLLRSGRDVLLFDTRQKNEFEVSRIPGAVRLDPAVHTDVIVGRVRRRAKGAVIVFYCTSMARSATIAEWASVDLKALGADAVYVLVKGIIGWTNADLPLIDSGGATKFVHPFDKSMTVHLKHAMLVRFEPMPPKR